MDTMKGPYGFQYARIAVPDIDASVAWYDQFVGLTAEERTDDHAYLRATTEHHSIELLADGSLDAASVRAFGFTVENGEVLEQLHDRVKSSGAELVELDKRQKGLCADGFACLDPNGMTLEFVTDFYEYAELPEKANQPVTIVHPFIGTPNYEASVRFYLDVLGFRASDYIADKVAFIRSENRLHHSYAIRQADQYEVAHICFMVQSFDHMMRARARCLYHGVTIGADIVNHSASLSIAFYMDMPEHGPPIELCDDHRVLTEEEHATMRPRVMAADARNIDVWRAAADDWRDLL